MSRIPLPLAVILIGPLLGLLYLAVTGGVEVLDAVFATTNHPLSTFAHNTIEGMLYHIIGLGLMFGDYDDD